MITTNFKASDIDLGADFVPYEQSGLIPAADKKLLHPAWANPDPFSFTPVNNAARLTDFTSNTVTITGLTPNVSVVIDAFDGLVDAGTSALSGTFASSKTVTASATGTIVVAARGTSSAEFTTPVSVTVVIGRQRSVFVITTGALNSLPNAFSFTNVSNAAISYVYTSNTVTISGLTASYSFTVSATGGTVDAGTTTLSGTFSASKTVTTSPTGTLVVVLRTTSSSSYTTATNVTVTVGTGQSVWTVTTSALDTAPDPFNLGSNVTGASLSTYYESTQVLVTGLTPNHTVSVSAPGSGYVNAGTSSTSNDWYSSLNVTTSLSGTLVLKARCYSSGSYNTTTSVTITVNGVSATFYVTTMPDLIPNPFSFPAKVNTDLNRYIVSDTITVTGLTPNTGIYVAVTDGYGFYSGWYDVDAGTTSLSGVFEKSKSVTSSASGTLVIAARTYVSYYGGATAYVTVTISGVSATFNATGKQAQAIMAWGSNSSGQYGWGGSGSRSVPVGPVFLTENVTNFAAGEGSTYLVTDTSKMYVAGNNTYGQLGLSNTNSSSYFLQVPGSWKLVGQAGGASTLAITPTGTVWAWGDNQYGQLGLGNTLPTSSPTVIPGFYLSRITANKSGSFTLGIAGNATLWAWGNNSSGQLGLGNTTSRSSPAQVGTSTWFWVAAGQSHTIGTKVDGTLWAWGHNWYGQLGHNNTTFRSSPVQVGAATGWHLVSASGSVSAAIKTDGTLWAWGDNGSGQLGLGDTSPRSSPTQVGSLTNWKQVSVTPSYMIAVKTDGTLWSWGTGTQGQLGIGSVSATYSPVQIGTGTNWNSVDAAASHALGKAV